MCHLAAQPALVARSVAAPTQQGKTRPPRAGQARGLVAGACPPSKVGCWTRARARRLRGLHQVSHTPRAEGEGVGIGKKAAASRRRPAASKNPRDLHTPPRPRGDGGSIAASRQAAAFAARRKGCARAAACAPTKIHPAGHPAAARWRSPRRFKTRRTPPPAPPVAAAGA